MAKQYDARKLTPTQRLESLAERNFKPTGDKETDRRAVENIEKHLKQAKQVEYEQRNK